MAARGRPKKPRRRRESSAYLALVWEMVMAERYLATPPRQRITAAQACANICKRHAGSRRTPAGIGIRFPEDGWLITKPALLLRVYGSAVRAAKNGDPYIVARQRAFLAAYAQRLALWRTAKPGKVEPLGS